MALIGGSAGGGLLVLALLVLLIVVILRRMASKRRTEEANEADLSMLRIKMKPKGGDEWEIDRDLLTLGKVIGEGHFGQVFEMLLFELQELINNSSSSSSSNT